ncbi:MAG TPA: glutathione S-transferase family protein [Burkholderiales bacterium]|nr:glutathione S-transferase family protein [Betaproteobacteria bacterium]HQR53685.1 glutathione S-transferase family protein [Burkholderiales bacterium]
MSRPAGERTLPLITLFQFEPAFGLPNASPFCMKVETYLRMTGLEYRIAPRASIMQAPKGKMPWIEDDGHVVADSGFIIDYLKERYGDPLDARLTPQERAVGLALRRLLEENLYWSGLMYDRWLTTEGWKLTRDAFFGGLPPPLRPLVATVARRGMRKELWGHGMGRHSAEEIQAIGRADLTALADFLGDTPYFMGERPTSLDACAYAFLANLLWAPLETPLQAHAQNYPQLEAYCRRMRNRYYPERAVAS